MINAPRIRLRSLFLLVFCCAVGLTTSADPLGALEPALETAIVIGLAQQTRRLLRWHPDELGAVPTLRFAKRFAVVWRILVAAALSTGIVRNMLLARAFMQEVPREEFLLIDPLNDGLQQLCVLIVICNSLFRWRSESFDRKPRSIGAPIFWVIGSLITLLMVLEGTTIDFLVHRAMANIEASQPSHLHRANAYVQLADESYRPIWFGGAAVFCVLAVGILATNRRSNLAQRPSALVRWPLFFVLLAIPGGYCVWYYNYGLARLSPDMAEAGLVFNARDLFGVIVLAALVIVAGAYRIARLPTTHITITPNMADNIEQNAFHESLPGLVLLAASACYSIVLQLMEFINYDPWIGTPSLGRYISMLCYPTMLLSAATAIGKLQFVWLRWRNRSREVTEVMYGIAPASFVESFVVLSLITIVGIPAIRAFIFTLWIGPWELLPIFGLH